MFDVKESVKKDPIRVMIVDDSAIIRGFLTKALDADSEIKILATAANGVIALNYIKKHDVEVLILDIEMPEMDGLTALPELLKANSNLKIIMVSTLTKQNAPTTIKALSLGASDYIEKPTARADSNNVEYFNLELINKVKSLGCSVRIAKAFKNSSILQAVNLTNKAGDAMLATRSITKDIKSETTRESSKGTITLRKVTGIKNPRALAIACSTGGPQALQTVFGSLKDSDLIKRIPIFITQHMPPIFTSYLANHIEKLTGIKTIEATDGLIVSPGTIYVAPGDFHMEILNDKSILSNLVIHLSKSPPENYCRPSADPMLRSLASIYKENIVLVVLTGMGQDGLEGAREIIKYGGNVIAQDEASSVVWGMPGAVALDGLCSAILPVDKITEHLAQLFIN
jgi:two-component system chemotaxis response regulator CheB